MRNLNFIHPKNPVYPLHVNMVIMFLWNITLFQNSNKKCHEQGDCVYTVLQISLMFGLMGDSCILGVTASFSLLWYLGSGKLCCKLVTEWKCKDNGTLVLLWKECLPCGDPLKWPQGSPGLLGYTLKTTALYEDCFSNDWLNPIKEIEGYVNVFIFHAFGIFKKRLFLNKTVNQGCI